MTIHITPESEFSYVSFESNFASSNYNDLINLVMDTFLLGKFIASIFANQVISTTTTIFISNFHFSILFYL